MSSNTDMHPSAVASTSRTITTPAMQQETHSILKELASMDNLPDDDPNDDDDIKLPIAPRVPPAQQAQHNTEGGPKTDIKPPLLPRVIGTAIKIEKPANTLPQKKVFKTVEYKLKRKYIKQRKFSCIGCNSSFKKQKELNEHFGTSHPPVKCDMCKKHFDTPVAMKCHKYKDYDYMHECEVCGSGFQFTSQLQEHKRVHQKQGDWVCFQAQMWEKI